MSIKCLKEFDLCIENPDYFGIVPVNMGGGKKAYFCAYSGDDVDPGEEYFYFPEDTMKFALFDADGKRLWTKDLGKAVIPGTWFCPALPLDLDKDGIDEIYFVNNLNPKAPLSMVNRRLEAISPINGETIGQWEWPMNTFDDRLSLCYRFYLVAGYSHGDPVLVTCQGTYGDMYLQGYGPGMVKKWDRKIPKDEGGPKASHLTPVIDINDDGVDELFWGERLISLETGEDVFCFDRSFEGHSDIIMPFVNYDTGKKYLYTAREDPEFEPPRVVTFDAETGDVLWTALEEGHMHYGWLGVFGDEQNVKRVAAATRFIQHIGASGNEITGQEQHYYDAFTGEELNIILPFQGYDAMPIDINGDGFSEFFCMSGEHAGSIFDRHGNLLFKIDGEFKYPRSARLISEVPCEQLIIKDNRGHVQIYGDDESRGSKIFNYKHEYKGYHDFCERLMLSGYNRILSHSMCCI